jgi:hypothetical protein
LFRAIWNNFSNGISTAFAIIEITLVRAKEQYSPASKNQGCPLGSIRKSNRNWHFEPYFG